MSFLLYEYPGIIKEAGNTYSPALIANYVYELAKEYNQFYHDFSILGEGDEGIRNFRLVLSRVTSGIIYTGMWLLGIEMPERM